MSLCGMTGSEIENTKFCIFIFLASQEAEHYLSPVLLDKKFVCLERKAVSFLRVYICSDLGLGTARNNRPRNPPPTVLVTKEECPVSLHLTRGMYNSHLSPLFTL